MATEPRSAPRRRRGLTLIELAAVMAVLAVLATLAVPSFADMQARHRLRAAAEQLAADLTEARLRSAERGQPQFVEFHAGADACWTVAAQAPCDCRIAQACRLKTTKLADYRGITLAEHLPAAFLPEGAGSGRAVLSNAMGQTLRVDVLPMGRARVCSPEGADPRVPAC